MPHVEDAVPCAEDAPPVPCEDAPPPVLEPAPDDMVPAPLEVPACEDASPLEDDDATPLLLLTCKLLEASPEAPVDIPAVEDACTTDDDEPVPAEEAACWELALSWLLEDAAAPLLPDVPPGWPLEDEPPSPAGPPVQPHANNPTATALPMRMFMRAVCPMHGTSATADAPAAVPPLDVWSICSHARRMCRQLHIVFVLLGTVAPAACAGTSTEGRTHDVAEQEPNDTPSTQGAQVLPAVNERATITVRGNISRWGVDGSNAYTGDLDFYAVNVNRASDVTVTLRWEGTANLDVHLLGMTPQGADTTRNNPATLARAVPAGTYFVQVASTDSAAEYTLVLEFEPTG